MAAGSDWPSGRSPKSRAGRASLATALALAVVAGLGSLTACVRDARPPAAAVPLTAQLVTLDGEAVALGEVIGNRIAVVDFWASWCEACRDTLPKLVRLADAYRGRDLVVIGVNVGEDAATARAFAADHGLTYTILLDPEHEFAESLGATGLPVVLVLERDGTVAHRGKQIDRAALARIRELAP
jgi:thiol-disulfide isomerase/thioredoxin